MTIFILALILSLVAAGLIYEALSARSDGQRLAAPGRLVQVSGLSLHLKCSGSGTTTIVLEAGLGDSALVWSEVQASLSKSTRICSYDRAGLAWSESGEAWDAQLAVEQLRELLKEAGETPPFVLVGHSLGASYARLFTHAYPSEVKALVLIEPPLFSEISPAAVILLKTLRLLIGGLSCLGVMRLLGRTGQIKILFGGSTPPPEVSAAAGFLYRPRSIRASLREVDALPGTIKLLQESYAPGVLGNLPLLVISARSKSDPPARLIDALDELSRLSSRGRVVYIHGSHFLHFDTPDILVRHLREFIEEIP